MLTSLRKCQMFSTTMSLFAEEPHPDDPSPLGKGAEARAAMPLKARPPAHARRWRRTSKVRLSAFFPELFHPHRSLRDHDVAVEGDS